MNNTIVQRLFTEQSHIQNCPTAKNTGLASTLLSIAYVPEFCRGAAGHRERGQLPIDRDSTRVHKTQSQAPNFSGTVTSVRNLVRVAALKRSPSPDLSHRDADTDSVNTMVVHEDEGEAGEAEQAGGYGDQTMLVQRVSHLYT